MLKALAGAAAGSTIVVFALLVLLVLSPPVRAAECGLASYYCCQHHGRLTASGERFNQNAMTAAHKSMPFGTKLRVTYRGRSVVVRVSDRGPFVRGRVLDLSRGAAAKLGMVNAGVGKVCYERISP